MKPSPAGAHTGAPNIPTSIKALSLDPLAEDTEFPADFNKLESKETNPLYRAQLNL